MNEKSMGVKPNITGTVAVAHDKGGAGATTIASTLFLELRTRLENVVPIDLEPRLALRSEKPQPGWDEAPHGSALLVVSCDVGVTDEQTCDVLDRADVVVFVMPVDPQPEHLYLDPDPAKRPAPEARIPRELAHDRRLIVVVNDGAGPPRPRPRLFARPKQGTSQVPHLPFDSHLQRSIAPIELDALDQGTRAAIASLADSVLGRVAHRATEPANGPDPSQVCGLVEGDRVLDPEIGKRGTVVVVAETLSVRYDDGSGTWVLMGPFAERLVRIED